MSRFLKSGLLCAGAALVALPAIAQSSGLGRAALPEEVAAWDIDIRPDGAGLPDGSGDVWTGEELYEAQCAHCHGTFGEGMGSWPMLAGGQGSLTHEHPQKTIGSYWPYLSTVWDYVNRAMPYGAAQSLTPDEVYAITAYLMYLNDLVDDDFELSRDNFGDIRLPNEDGFYLDDRVALEWPVFTQAPCMSDCKPDVQVTMRAAVLDVTPDDPTADARRAQARAMAAASGGGDAAASTPEVEPDEEASAAHSPELIAQGESLYRACRSCHQVGDGARNSVGPVLNGILGRVAGRVEGFRYSPALTGAGDAGLIWTEDTVSDFIADPRGYLPRNRMSYAGLRDADERRALVAYLSTYSE
ncbi:MAG: c-type cytochrome [Rhodobacteraceae bacterium]|nr:c-type cytochrome [Paracoccaceae bacterium]